MYENNLTPGIEGEQHLRREDWLHGSSLVKKVEGLRKLAVGTFIVGRHGGKAGESYFFVIHVIVSF